MTSKEKLITGFTEVFAWGSDHSGQMGLAGNKGGKNYPIPRFCSFNVIISSISCGEAHSAFIASSGYIYTMGSNEDGRLGISSRNVKFSASPCLVEVLSRYKASKVSCGWGHTAAITESGELFTWGNGADGQLGIGSMNNHHSPQMVAFINPSTSKSINMNCFDVDCGAMHTGVLSESGELFLFGSNDHGQLGTGKTEREIFPFKVDLLSKVQSFSCGNKHTLALTEQGKAFGTGCNSTGELGIGNRKSSSIFTKITFQADGNLKKVAAGQHSAAITESGELYLWGTGTFGEFLVPQKIAGIKNPFIELAVGGGFGCAVDIGGSVYSWGNNKYGELGLGDYEPRITPTYLSSLQGKRVTSVSCGGNYAMALGVTIMQKAEDQPVSRRYEASSEVKSEKETPKTKEVLTTREFSIDRKEISMHRDKSFEKLNSDKTDRAKYYVQENYRRGPGHQRTEDTETSEHRIGREKNENVGVIHKNYSPYSKHAELRGTELNRSQNVQVAGPIHDRSHSRSRIEEPPYVEKIQAADYVTFDAEKSKNQVINVSFSGDRGVFKAANQKSPIPEPQKKDPRELDKLYEDFSKQFRNNNRSRYENERSQDHHEKRLDTREPEVSDFRKVTAREESERRRSSFHQVREEQKSYRQETLGDESYSRDNIKYEREIKILKDQNEDLKRQLAHMDKVQIEDIRYREKAYDKKTEKYEKTIRELEEKVKDLEKKLEYDRETNLGWKKLLEEEKNANEKNLKTIGELEKSLRDAECDIRKLNEKSHKTSYDVLEAEKERDYYKKRLEEVQKKIERQALDYNDALKVRENEIQALEAQRSTTTNAIEELNDALRKLTKENTFDKEKIERLEKDRVKDTKLLEGLNFELLSRKENIDRLERIKQELEDRVNQLTEGHKEKTDEIKKLAEELGKKTLEVEEAERKLRHLDKLFEDKKAEVKELRGLAANLETSIQTKNLEIKHLRITIDELNYKSGKSSVYEPRPSPTRALNEDLSRGEFSPFNQVYRDYDFKNKSPIRSRYPDSEPTSFIARRRSQLDEDIRTSSPFGPTAQPRMSDSPIMRAQARNSSPDIALDRSEEHPHRREKSSYIRHLDALSRFNKSESKEMHPTPTSKDLGESANKLMELLGLDSKMVTDRSNLDTIKEEESSSAFKSGRGGELHYTAKFSNYESVERSDIKKLHGHELPLESKRSILQTTDREARRETLESVIRQNERARSRTPEVKTSGEKTNLKDLKIKLQDLQKNKVALEQRMHDFERKLQDSKKKI